jgi:hypothetical protein
MKRLGYKSSFIDSLYNIHSLKVPYYYALSIDKELLKSEGDTSGGSLVSQL